MTFAKCKVAWLLLVMFAAASCRITPRQEPLPYTKPPEEVKFGAEILDYQNRSYGLDLAEWVSLYIDGGIPALEKAAEFAPYYVFVAEQSSPDIETLMFWRDNFNLEQYFPQLVFLRAYRRLTNNLSINPDETYGAFFETLMKRIAALGWPPARVYAGMWLRVRYFMEEPDESSLQQDGDIDTLPEFPVDPILYTYLILAIIEKPEIENVLNALMDETSDDVSLQRDQAQAVNAVRSNFFSTF